MICCSINKGNADEILKILDKVEMAEIRLDMCRLSDEEIETVFSSDTPLIVTCRTAGEGGYGKEGSCGGGADVAEAVDWRYTERVLTLAIKAGARYVDLEIEAPKPVSKRLAQACAEWGTTMIRSYHDFTGTPSLDELKAVADRCRHHDGDIVKIATMAQSDADVERVLSLYKYYTPESLVAFAMGPEGVRSRLECLRKGAPWSYAYYDGNAVAAEAEVGLTAAPGLLPSAQGIILGQMPYREMWGKVYGTWRPLNGPASDSESDSSPAADGTPVSPASVTLRMPCSKSYAQRAIIAAALANGTSVLHGYTPCGDNESALRVAETLGAKVNCYENGPKCSKQGEKMADCYENGPKRSKQGCAATLEITGGDAAGAIGVSHRVVKTSGRPRPDGGARFFNLDVLRTSARHEVVGGADCLAIGVLTPCGSVDGAGASARQLRAKAPERPVVNVGESGLLTRLMLPLCCLLRPEGVTITGEGTLKTRPLDGADRMIAALGGALVHGTPAFCGREAEKTGLVHENPASGGREDEDHAPDPETLTLPLTVTGPLKGGRIDIDGSKTSQLVSGALMALPMLQRNSTLSVKNPTSIPYVYMTMDILRKFGIKIRSEMYGGRQILDQDWSKCTEMVLKVKENQTYKAAELDLEGDWSAAAVFMAAGAIFGKVAIEGLDTTSLQADLMMLDILMEAGASVSQMDEPSGIITVQKAPLQAFKADLTNSPDLFPVVSVFCAFCQGRSTLRGLHRLVHKESDRAEGIKEMLGKLGVRYTVKGDDLLIDGESLDSRIMTGHLLEGGKFSSCHDHRMVMALRLAELGVALSGHPAKGTGSCHAIEIDDTDCVAKSYPGFNDIWNECIRKQIKG